ncbi:esterase family protein [Gordonia sp. GONU]|uniref:alpha/beta hydrolase n=1 Tax=Gordonia TaxID=2053 RepID=UPI0021ABB486|nr:MULTISPECIES: alpha/beta hydrolase family protein [Gordonia]MCR8895618.1 esterase family protein [Gordonia sp. GONU]MCZ0913521.1 alpha/beta hydrolase family protein [Gordonia amicalis]
MNGQGLTGVDGRRMFGAVGLVALSVLAMMVGLPSRSAAEPNPASIVAEYVQPAGEIDLAVRSTAMRQTVTVKVLPARGDRPAPTLYLLNGAAGGDGGSSWFDRTDIRTYFADQNVNVVVPMGGAASYFTDWQHPDPALGVQKWATFLTSELPAVIDRRLDGNGRNAIAGISMAGTSVFQLSLHAPELYEALGSFSGCAQTSDPMGQAVVRMVVEGRGHGNTLNMWGPPTSPAWRANDPYVHAASFRGKSIYVSNGSGTPGRYDTIDGPGIDGNGSKLFDQLAVGAVIETATAECTRNLQRRLREVGVPATFHLYPGGTHSWPYWQDELHRAWPQFRAALAR